MSLLFDSLLEIKIKIDNRLNCIDIFDDDCILVFPNDSEPANSYHHRNCNRNISGN